MSAKMLPAMPAVDARVSDILHQAAVRAKTGSICEIMQEKILCVARRYQMRHDTAGWQLLGARHHAGVPAAYAMNRTSVFGATDITRLTEMSQQIFAWPSCKLRRTKHPGRHYHVGRRQAHRKGANPSSPPLYSSYRAVPWYRPCSPRR
jgi:hypothetical protein